MTRIAQPPNKSPKWNVEPSMMMPRHTCPMEEDDPPWSDQCGHYFCTVVLRIKFWDWCAVWLIGDW